MTASCEDRTEHIRMVIDAINQKGQHVLVYGERGVGKTSLANVLESFLAPKGKNNVIAPPCPAMNSCRSSRTV